jgi:proteasome assembly chaperone (PAC2) family protein
MEHVRLLADRALHNPVMLFAFTGWNDAGEAASAAVRTMVNHWGATLIADIDPEVFTDFATVRPSVYLSEGRRHILWPTVQVWGASLPGADAILIVGPEPALQWRLFTQQIVGLAEHFDVSMSISLGALLADVPHTHPVHVIGTSSEPELIDRFDLQRSTYEGPTGIVGVLQDAMAAADVPAASLWATVPGYTAQIPSPKACEALMRTACSMIGTTVPSGAFTRAIADYEARVAALVAEDDDLASYVTRLESMMDDADDDTDEDDDTASGDDTAEVDRFDNDDDVDPEQFLAEVEQFLRDAGPPGDERPASETDD